MDGPTMTLDDLDALAEAQAEWDDIAERDIEADRLAAICRRCDGLGVVILATPAQIRTRGAAITEGRAEPFDAGCLPCVECAACRGDGWLPGIEPMAFAAD